jgi:molybdopterin-containing oxidoreductase family membrane subunit
MSHIYDSSIRKPLVIGDKTYHDVTVDVAAPVEGKTKHWWIVFSIALTAFLWGLGCIVYTVSTGIGTWGLNKTVAVGIIPSRLLGAGGARKRTKTLTTFFVTER